MLGALFRFIDGLDIGQHRIGGPVKSQIHKTETLKNDVLSYSALLRKQILSVLDEPHQVEQVKSIIDQARCEIAEMPPETHSIPVEFVKQLNEFVVTNNLYDLQDLVAPTLEYIRFISRQLGHIRLHEAISRVEIVPSKEDANIGENAASPFSLLFHSDKDLVHFGLAVPNEGPQFYYVPDQVDADPKRQEERHRQGLVTDRYKTDKITLRPVEDAPPLIPDGDGKYEKERTLAEHLLLWYVWKEWAVASAAQDEAKKKDGPFLGSVALNQVKLCCREKDGKEKTVTVAVSLADSALSAALETM
ncbi:hypothetical protein ACFLSJ_03370 [Verrucomicrobiota bacterium]